MYSLKRNKGGRERESERKRERAGRQTEIMSDVYIITY